MMNLSVRILRIRRGGSKVSAHVPLSKPSTYFRLGLLGASLMPFLIVVLHGVGYEVKLWGCLMKALLGIPCPSWGMTRAMFAIADAQWSQAIHYHLLAPLAVILWGVGVVQISFELWTKRVWSVWWRRRGVCLSGLLIVFGYHGYRLYDLWMSGMLAAYIQQSWLHNLL